MCDFGIIRLYFVCMLYEVNGVPHNVFVISHVSHVSSTIKLITFVILSCIIPQATRITKDEI